MIARPTISTVTFGATALSSDPTQKTAMPATMTRLRPIRSPSVPNASMRLAKTSA